MLYVTCIAFKAARMLLWQKCWSCIRIFCVPLYLNHETYYKMILDTNFAAGFTIRNRHLFLYCYKIITETIHTTKSRLTSIFCPITVNCFSRSIRLHNCAYNCFLWTEAACQMDRYIHYKNKKHSNQSETLIPYQIAEILRFLWNHPLLQFQGQCLNCQPFSLNNIHATCKILGL